MILLWKIRYLDRADKEFKDRNLYLDTHARTHTHSLDPVTRATVELLAKAGRYATGRKILEFRHLFVEDPKDEARQRPLPSDGFYGVGPSEYFEDETGKEISENEIAQVLTGNPNAISIPAGAKPHDIELMLAPRGPLPIAEVVLADEEKRILGYFSRDLDELRNSAFMEHGAGTLESSQTGSGMSEPVLKTVATDDEIRSFVTIFRRLYMTNEPAHFRSIVPLFANALGPHPFGAWAVGVAGDFEAQLDSMPDFRPYVPVGVCTFNVKRLIDVFLYTQYAHQPNESRQRQFNECLGQLRGKRQLLTFLFLGEMWKSSRLVIRAGNVIVDWFKQYCDFHDAFPDVLLSLRDHHPGIGTLESEADRKERLIREKAEELALKLWAQRKRPEGGPEQFRNEAREQLRRALE